MELPDPMRPKEHGLASPTRPDHPEVGDLEKGVWDRSQIQSQEPTDTCQTADSKKNPLDRIITSRSAVSYDPGPPPDGGVVAWTQAFMAHFVIFTTWGYINSYGVFQTYYTTALNRPPSDISWIGSVQIFLIFFIGTASGRAMDAGLFKHVLVCGVILQLIGLFASSFCTQYWQLFLAQGICMGLGNGLQFCPTMALLSTYFTKHRSLVMGIAASGSATGGMIFPAIVKELLPKIGFGWTIRTIAFLNLAIGILTCMLLKTRLPPRKSGPLVEWGAFRETPYLLYVLGMFLNFWGLYFGFYYIISFGRDKIGMSYSESVSLLLALNGVGSFARVAPNFIADKYAGPLNTVIPFALASGLLVYCWAAVHNVAGTWVFAIIYGMSTAGIQGLFPAALSTLTIDQKKSGTRMGMGFSVVSIACLTGPPLAGALIQLHPDGSYIYAQMWAASALLCGGLTLCAARVAKTGWKLWERC